MTQIERLRQRIAFVHSLLERTLLDETLSADSFLNIHFARMTCEELLGNTSFCTCLAHPFPHKRGKECPLNIGSSDGPSS
jgi:hypothetical protein